MEENLNPEAVPQGGSEAERIKYLRKTLKMTQAEFAEELGIRQYMVSGIERGEHKISYTTYKGIITRFGVNPDWLLNGYGDAFIAEGGGTDRRILVVRTNRSYMQEIVYIPESERLAYPQRYTETEYIKEQRIIRLPGYSKGTYRAFEVYSDGMFPTFSAHDIVIGSFVKDCKELKEGEVYVFIASNFLIIKRFKSSGDKIELHSDNSFYSPFSVEKSEIKESWKVVSKISKNLSYEKKSVIGVEERVGRLEELVKGK